MSETGQRLHTIELSEPNARIGLAELRRVYAAPVRLALGAATREAIDAAEAVVATTVRNQRVVYGINTG